MVLKLEASCTVKLCNFKSYEVSGVKCVTTKTRVSWPSTMALV